MFTVKNDRIWKILMWMILGLQVLAEALTVAVILRLDMLPGKFVLVLVGIMALLVLATGLMMFIPAKKKAGTGRRVTACILALIIVIGCVLITKVVTDTYSTVSNVTSAEINTASRDSYILVRTEDPAQTLQDAADYTFAAIEHYNEEQTAVAVDMITQAISKEPALKYYEQGIAMAEALFAKDVDALIMNGASAALLLEEEGYSDFFERVRVLSVVPYQQEDQPDETEPTEEVQKKDITNTPFIVYVSGSDTRSSVLSVSRSDVNILMVVNPVSKQVLLLNTPRDYYIPNPAGNGKLDKLTHCGLYGVDCSMEALEGLYGIDITHYGQINFKGFETLIDAIGGITVVAEHSFKTEAGYIQKGENFLNGHQALFFARERYNVSGGDNGRGRNQMRVITAVIEKMTNGTTIISNYAGILDSLEGTFSTDLQMSDISSLVKMQLSDMAKWNVKSFAVIGTNGSEKTYSAPGHYASVMYPNDAAVAQASQLVQKVLDGAVITDEDLVINQ